MRRGLGAIGPAALALLTFACTSAGRLAEPPPNVLLLTVDCLRPDRLGSSGVGATRTPHLDAFAREAAVFTRARAVSAWTLPGVVSLLTGAYPSTHGMDARGRTPADLPHLAELLVAAGYRAPALTSLIRQPGMERFAVGPPAVAGPEERPGDHLVDWLRSPDAAAGPFFAWYHWRSIHLPYEAEPEEFPRDRLDSPGVRQVRSFLVLPAELQSFLPEEHPTVRALYDAEVRAFDAGLARVLAILDERGLSDRTIVVLTADHGEELFEHGLLGHASTTERATLYEEVLRIPLLIRRPGAAPRRVDCPVSQVDLLPTLLASLGLPPPPGVEGVNLLPVIEGGPCPDRPLFAESVEGGYQAHGASARRFVWGVVEDEVKLVERRGWDGDVERELYDLRADPAERRDLGAAAPDLARRLAARLDGFRATHGGPDAWKRPLEEVPERLRRRPSHLREAATPRMLAPADGARIAFTEAGGLLTASWSGSPVGRYVVEYDVGEEPVRVHGTFEVTGTQATYGPFSADLWRGLVQYNPWRLRVWPALDPQRASDWVVVRLEP